MATDSTAATPVPAAVPLYIAVNNHGESSEEQAAPDANVHIVDEKLPLLLFSKSHHKSTGTFVTSDETTISSNCSSNSSSNNSCYISNICEQPAKTVVNETVSWKVTSFGSEIQAHEDTDKSVGHQAEDASNQNQNLAVESKDPIGGSCAFGVDAASSDQHEEDLVLDTIVEGVKEEFQEVTQAVRGEFFKAENDDECYMMRMGLTRNLSLLPCDIVDAAMSTLTSSPPPPEKGGGDDDQDDIEKVPLLPDKEDEGTVASTKTMVAPVGAYFLLASAIVAMSSIGPLLQLQHDVSACMKIFWRMAGTGLILLPFASAELYQCGLPAMTGPQWAVFLLSTVSYDVLCVAFCLALEYTAVGNAVILANSMSLILLVGKFCSGGPVTVWESVGAIVAFGGASLCSKDSSEVHGDVDSFDGFGTLVGDMLALLSAVGGVGYVACAKATRPHMPIYLFMFLTMTIGCALILIFQVLVLKETVSNDRNSFHGLWGGLGMGGRSPSFGTCHGGGL